MSDLRRVLKWPVPVDGHAHPIGWGPVVLVECQYGPHHVQVWTEEPDPTPQGARPTIVIGTGHPIPEGWVHIGSTMTAGGGLVWHLYAQPASPTTEGATHV